MASQDIYKALLNVVSQCLPVQRMRRAVCVYQHGEAFWHGLTMVFQELGITLQLVHVDTSSTAITAWIPRPNGGSTFYMDQLGNYQADLTILGLPLIPIQVDLYAAIYDLECSKSATLLFEWLADDVPPRLRPALIEVYLNALNIDYGELRKTNAIISAMLAHGDWFVVRSDEGTQVSFRRKNRPIIREDCQFTEDETVFQLPGGEVFFAPEEGTAEGMVVFVRGSQRYLVTIHDGIADFSQVPGMVLKAPLAEFGIGTNRRCLAINFLSLGEKAEGTCHFGFGDNRQFGGEQQANFHFDVVVKGYTIEVVSL